MSTVADFPWNGRSECRPYRVSVVSVYTYVIMYTYLCIHLYIFTCIYVCICIYIYMTTHADFPWNRRA